MEYLVYFIFGAVSGMALYIFIDYVIKHVDDNKGCNGNCNQGRNKCDCK